MINASGIPDGPIPGQSLTMQPGNARWEHPPQFTDLDKACEFMWNRIVQPKNLARMLTFLEEGMPVASLTSVLLFSGFTEGKWTPDLMLLMSRPVGAMVYGIAKRAGINVRWTAEERDELDELMEGLVEGSEEPEEAPPTEPDEMIEPPRPMTGGLLGRAAQK